MSTVEKNLVCALGAVKFKIMALWGMWRSEEHGAWSAEQGVQSAEEQTLKSMQETNQGQGSVGECVCIIMG